MAIDPKRVKEIFLEAAELSDEAARVAYLDKACGADAGVRERVEALLRSHDPEGSFLGIPAAVVPDPDHDATQALTGTPNPVEAATRTAGGENSASEDEPLTFLAPPTRPDALGRIGHYAVLQMLGRGGFGIVFRAFDEVLQRVVALKVMAPQLAATSPARKRFLREARSSAQVRHENVVQVYEVAEQPLPYLAMEFIPGETLQQRLDRVGPLDVPEVLRIGRQIAEGLAAAHATDLIHRDIKPGNVLLEGGQQKVRITDFGLARTADDASISQSGIIAGTPMYMAPEQALGQTLDQRADLFSLGSVLYQMAAGRPPFRANSAVAVLKRVAEDTPRAIREVIPETPPWLCAIIAKLHAKDPDERYQSAREAADVLADCEAQLKANARLKDYSRIPRSKPRRSGPPPRLRSRRWAAAAAVLLLVLGGLGFTEATGVTRFRGTVIRLFSPEGTLVVEVDDPGVSVKIDESGLVIAGAGAKEIRLKPGSYTVEAHKDGKLVSRELVAVTKNGRQVVRISQETPPLAAKEKGSGAPTRPKAGFAPFTDAEGQRIAALAAFSQIEEVRKELVRRNPGFDGTLTPTIENGVVTGLKFSSDEVDNVEPVRALKGLTSLDCRGTYSRMGKLWDLSPLKGMALTSLELSFTRVRDLGPLKGMPLRELALYGATNVADLTPLKGMKLQSLAVQRTSVSDLTPLEGMPLGSLDLHRAEGVTDLRPLRGMPLGYLNLSHLTVSDLSLLKGMTSLERLAVHDMKQFSNLKPLEGLRLRELDLLRTGVTDLSPLRGMALTHIVLPRVKNITRGLELLRGMKSLTTIGVAHDRIWPAAGFWERYDKGEFKE